VAGKRSLTGEHLDAAVTDALERIHADHLERRPQRSLTFHHDNVVVTVMYRSAKQSGEDPGAEGQTA